MPQKIIDTPAMYVNSDRKTMVINYDNQYNDSEFKLVNSNAFAELVILYLSDPAWQQVPAKINQSSPIEYVNVIKHILIGETADLPYARADILSSFEDLYSYYRSLLRVSVINKQPGNKIVQDNFMNTDNKFNQTVLKFYRQIEENLQGHVNNIYRQINAGTNACLVTRQADFEQPAEYQKLAGIPIIDTLMIRPPMIVHTKSNRREGIFSETQVNPIKNFQGSAKDWFCFPAWMGESLAYIYFHRDYLASGLALGNLFALADLDKINGKKPDIVLLFGSSSDASDDQPANGHYYYDAANQWYVGQVPYNDQTTYFGYMKKMALTLHNLHMISKHKLPIHGSMVKINFANGKSKSVVFFGDSGAGKSESIEALQEVASDQITSMETIFDDMGSFTLTHDDEAIYAQGTETGAFVRLDDLSSAVAFSNMDRGVYMNPELSNARCIIPANTYENIIQHHHVDMWLYANNYSQDIGVHRFNNEAAAKQVFVAGKRKALGTTDEVGMSTTFFANPFGPVQQQAATQPIIDEVFQALFKKGTYVGEIYTHLGNDKSQAALQESARELLKLLNQ